MRQTAFPIAQALLIMELYLLLSEAEYAIRTQTPQQFPQIARDPDHAWELPQQFLENQERPVTSQTNPLTLQNDF